MSRPRIFIVSYSNIGRDARVLRQAEYLSRHFDVVLSGWGEPVTQFPGVEWRGLPSGRSRVQRLIGLAVLAAGRIVPAAYRLWFRLRPGASEARAIAMAERCDVYYANDWLSLPAMADAAAHNGGALVLDAHEYSPLEWENSRPWRLFYRPLILRTLKRYAPRCAASITVSRPIAARYASEYPLEPIVVLNAPALPELPSLRPVGETIRLIHHGSAIRERGLERMIDTVGLTRGNVHLDLMLVGNDAYVAELRQHAARVAPGRVNFVPPVPPREIASALQRYDLGFYLLDTEMYNHAMAMPNKIFDFLAAGLGVCIGPSPAMREIVEEFAFGVVCPSIEPSACAAVLDSLTPAQVERFKAGSHVARRSLNADVEMAKLVRLLDGVVQGRARQVTREAQPRLS